MSRLNQIIVVEKGVKARVHSELSELYKSAQKPELFNGFIKTYQKKEEEGEEFPPERKRVQFIAADVLRSAERMLSELMSVTARKDWANTVARADIKVGDVTILREVPVTYLLFLEKQITDVRTFIEKIPTLDEADDWTKDENAGLFKTQPQQTHRTRKVPKAIVLYPATEQHPAQTQLTAEDIIAGFWNTVKQSGALPKPERDGLLLRVNKLLSAVKEAREAANSAEEVEAPDTGAAIFEYLLGQ